MVDLVTPMLIEGILALVGVGIVVVNLPSASPHDVREPLQL
jgi:hypothetical protein